MSDETTSNGKSSHDEKTSGLAKLESLSQEELIKIVKNQLTLKKKLEAKIQDLTNTNPIESENQKLKIRCEELENQLSLVHSSLINESQKCSSHAELLSQSISTIIDLFQLPLSIPDSIDSEFVEIYRNELEQKQENFKQEKLQFQERIEDLEFLTEEMKLENDDLRLKSKSYEQDKQKYDKEIDNYRRQIEDFEEQFLELQRESHHQTFDKSQQQPSIHSSRTTLHPLEDDSSHPDEISLQCLNSILNQIDNNQTQQISKSSSTTSLLLSSDIPTLLHSIGITNCTDDEFTIPLNFESVLHLCTLLIERCRVLQYTLWKNDPNPMSDEHDWFSIKQNQQIEQCRISIHRHDHVILDKIFERIYAAMNMKIKSHDWQILLERSLDRMNPLPIRLQFDEFIFLSDDIEQDIIRLRHQYEQLSKENEKQRREISTLENRLHSNHHHPYDLLKFHQTQLEEQLAQQCRKTIELENILQQANIDKIQLDRLKQLQISYEQLEEKYNIAQRLEEQLKELNKQYQEKLEFIEQIQRDYEQEHRARLHVEKLLQIEEQKGSRLQTQSISEEQSLFNVDQNIREENEKLHQTIRELNDKIERQNSTENIQELKEKYQKMKVLLTRLKKELQDKNYQPKQSLIDLELADYEKTIENLKKDLNNKDKDLQDLRDELNNSMEKNVCLKKEIHNLEEQISQTEERANKFKCLLDTAKKEFQQVQNQHLQNNENEDYTRSLIETLQNQLEKKTQLVNQLTHDKQQILDKFHNQMEKNQKTINLLEQNFRITKHELDLAKQNYDTLQDDFNSYKIRAQSVLKQQQTNQREHLPSLSEKNTQLEEVIEKYKSTLHDANNKMKLVISENEALQKEQDRLIEIQAKLINESRKRDQDLRKQHEIELNKIESDCLQRINDSHEMFKNVTLQNETLSIAFKEQLTSMELEHEKSIIDLQEQLRQSNEELTQLKIRLQLFEERTSTIDMSTIGINNDLNRDKIHAWNVVVSARQQEEIGEDFDSSNNKHPSLDQPVHTTLASSNEKSRDVTLENNKVERSSIDGELQQLKSRLIETTELFNESELNNQRLNEQVTLLKDEIRRLERNMDRAESISNLEYLKNVILKFFVLKSSPERLQLIPVLVTMLKLSPDEQVQLVRVANYSTIVDENFKTDESSSSSSQQIINDAAAASSSWSSYLNIW